MDLQTKKEQIIMHLAERHTSFRLFSKDEFLDMVEKNIQPFRRTMSFYKCAAMEVETKFKVLNEEMSLESEHNPIESIKT